MVNPNFTPVVDTFTHAIHYNVSYVISNQPPQMTTPIIFIIFALLGVGLLLFSRCSTEPTGKDLAGVMATPILLISAIQAFAVDTVTGSGVFGVCNSTIGDCIPEYVMLENHTIYHYDLIGVVLIIIFVLSIGNLYLLWLEHNKVNQQEQASVNPGKNNPGKRPNNQNDDSEDE